MCGIFSAGSDGAIASTSPGSSRGLRSRRIRGRARPSAACRRRCRGTAGRCCAPPPQRLDHAGHRVEAAPAVGEGADAGQHDAVGAAHGVGIARHDDRLGVARSRARRARTPWRPSADCPSRNRRWRRVIAASRLRKQADDAGSGRPRSPGATTTGSACVGGGGAAGRRVAHRPASRRSAARPPRHRRRRPRSEHAPAAAAAGPAPQRWRLRSPISSAIRTADRELSRRPIAERDSPSLQRATISTT